MSDQVPSETRGLSKPSRSSYWIDYFCTSMNANRLAGGVLRGVGWRRGVLLDWSGYFCLPWVSESSSSRGRTALVPVSASS